MKFQFACAAFVPLLVVASAAAAGGTPSVAPWSDAPYCQAQDSSDVALTEFRQEVAYILKRAFPSNYMTNVCVYRESMAFPGGAPGSLVATLDAENLQGLPTQPHTWSGDVACALTGDVPCVRVRQVQLYLPQTHVEAVRLPSAHDDNSKRIVAITRDTTVQGNANR